MQNWSLESDFWDKMISFSLNIQVPLWPLSKYPNIHIQVGILLILKQIPICSYIDQQLLLVNMNEHANKQTWKENIPSYVISQM